MGIRVFSGTSNPALAESIARNMDLKPGKLKIQRFPDGEINVELGESVAGEDVYLLQSTGPPVAENYLELLLMIDAVNRAGAERLHVIIPYLGYSRQGRRVTGNEPIGARVIAGLFDPASVSGIIVVNLHDPSVEGFFNLPVDNISTVSLLAGAVKKIKVDVVVSPDLGAVKLAESYAALLQVPVAIVHKKRLTGRDVKVHAVIGDIRGKRPLIIDDMISTAGTIEATANALLEAGCLPEISVAATHGLLVGPAVERLKNLPLKHLYLTNSLPLKPDTGLPVEEIDLGPLLAQVIKRLHNRESLVDLLVHL